MNVDVAAHDVCRLMMCVAAHDVCRHACVRALDHVDVDAHAHVHAHAYASHVAQRCQHAG